MDAPVSFPCLPFLPLACPPTPHDLLQVPRMKLFVLNEERKLYCGQV